MVTPAARKRSVRGKQKWGKVEGKGKHKKRGNERDGWERASEKKEERRFELRAACRGLDGGTRECRGSQRRVHAL